jgi:NADH-quinone oxidoreductase subunit L
MQFVIEHSYLIPLLPLIGAIVAGLFGARILKGNSHWPIWLGVGASAVMSLTLLAGMLGHHDEAATGERHSLWFASHWFTWISAGDESTGVFNANAGAWLDPLTAVMLSVVCGIGFFITVFAKGYMHGEKGYFRFFAYLGLFIFAMTCLVMGDNLAMLYLGWEGVGLCSYLLIGYYYDKPAAREAAKKAFIVNRIGDFGFAIGIFLVFYCFGTISYFENGPGTGTGFIEKAMAGAVIPGREHFVYWIPFFLMLGAFGKSAQFPLYTWLPDAMEGPTPVSALIHAATMVTAGVYMIVRLSTLFVGNTAAMVTIAVVGGFTALFAATIALRQNDLKKVFAYSTVSQLGYMFVGAAVLSPVAAVFHLVTHAFFKALLFLSSGVVMHATGGELDLTKMSGLKAVLPKTRILILIGCLALSGFPLLAGFWSKDEIVHFAGTKSLILQGILLLTSLLTAYYTFRLYFRVFEGPLVLPRGNHGHGDSEEKAHGHDHAGHHNHEPLSMMLPLVVLAIGALFVGVINLPFGAGIKSHALGDFLSQSPSVYLGYQKAAAVYGADAVDASGFGVHAEGHKETFNIVPLVIGGAVSLVGIGLAYLLHLQDRRRADHLAGVLRPLANGASAKYWVDELYNAVIVLPLRGIGYALDWIDRYVVDFLIGLFGIVPQLGGATLKFGTQRGYLQGYAVWMMGGLVLILLYVFL